MNDTSAARFDPRSPEFRADPYPAYRYLRTHQPIYHRAEQKGWILTRYADVAEVLAEFFRNRIAECRAGSEPGDDLIGMLIEEEGQLSEEELLAKCISDAGTIPASPSVLEWMNLDAGELEDIKCFMEKLTRKAENSKPNGRKKPVIDRILYPML